MILSFYKNCKKVSSSVSVTMHFGVTGNDLCDRSHYISAHVDGRRKEGGRGKMQGERTVRSRRKTIEVSEGG